MPLLSLSGDRKQASIVFLLIYKKADHGLLSLRWKKPQKRFGIPSIVGIEKTTKNCMGLARKYFGRDKIVRVRTYGTYVSQVSVWA